MGVVAGAFQSWAEYRSRRAVARRAMGRLANTRLNAAWDSFVDAVSESQLERKDEAAVMQLREMRRAMDDQAASAEAVKEALHARIAERCVKHWHHKLLTSCWLSWSAWVDQRVTWDMAVRQALEDVIDECPQIVEKCMAAIRGKVEDAGPTEVKIAKARQAICSVLGLPNSAPVDNGEITAQLHADIFGMQHG